MSDSSAENRLTLCPYCGNTQSGGDKCGQCGGLFEPLSRKATQISMGPWYIRDPRMPFRPGCSFVVIKRQAKAGKIKSTTVLRGPTTRQFWSVARNVPGVAHLIGYCHDCAEKISLDFRDQLRAMAPVTGHLHAHDSFGRPQGFYKGFHPQENTAMGIGDLHMPLGWGDIDWEDIFAELEFLPETVLMMEVGARYRNEQPESLERARKLIALNSHRTAVAAE